MGACGKEYKTMDDKSLLVYRYPLKPSGVLFMWATCPRLDFAMKCIEAHGLHFRGVAFVWVKTRADGEPMRACGVRPSIVKPLTELVLAASYVQRGRPMPLADESVCQTIFAPRRKHSQKPPAVHLSIGRMYPNASKAEFFAREHAPDWDCYGDELPHIAQADNAGGEKP
jgi:N6-adenosine-specific RNA methylase IME4